MIDNLQLMDQKYMYVRTKYFSKINQRSHGTRLCFYSCDLHVFLQSYMYQVDVNTGASKKMSSQYPWRLTLCCELFYVSTFQQRLHEEFTSLIWYDIQGLMFFFFFLSNTRMLLKSTQVVSGWKSKLSLKKKLTDAIRS